MCPCRTRFTRVSVARVQPNRPQPNTISLTSLQQLAQPTSLVILMRAEIFPGASYAAAQGTTALNITRGG